MNIEKGQIITARTYAEFLNKTFGTNYIGYGRSTYNYSNDIVVWMIRIDGKERKGFKNYMDGSNIVEESFTEPTRSKKPIRMVFRVIDIDKNTKNFVYLGKFKLSKDSTKTKRIFAPVE